MVSLPNAQFASEYQIPQLYWDNTGNTSAVVLGLEMDLLSLRVAHGLAKQGTYLEDFISRDINRI